MSFHYFEIDSIWLLGKKKVQKSNKKVVVKVKRNVVSLLVKCRSDEIISYANVLKVFALYMVCLVWMMI